MNKKLNLKNREMINALISSKSILTVDTIRTLVEIVVIAEKKSIWSLLIDNMDKFNNGNKDYLIKIYNNVKFIKPIRTINTDYSSTMEFQDRIEIIVKIKNFFTETNVLQELIKKDIASLINEKSAQLLEDEKNGSILFFKETQNNFQIETNLNELLNKDFSQIEKITFKWTSVFGENPSDDEIKKKFISLVSVGTGLYTSSSFFPIMVESLEIIFNNKLENFIRILIDKEKDEGEERLIGLMLKKIKNKTNRSFSKKETNGELIIYDYNNKTDIFINPKIPLKIDVTAGKILEKLKFLEDRDLIIFKRSTREKKNELSLKKIAFTDTKLLETIKSEISLSDFNKIEIRKVTG